jgi:hypothetical protein
MPQIRAGRAWTGQECAVAGRIQRPYGELCRRLRKLTTQGSHPKDVCKVRRSVARNYQRYLSGFGYAEIMCSPSSLSGAHRLVPGRVMAVVGCAGRVLGAGARQGMGVVVR